ncbi:MAG TPA: DUF1302 family protein [Rubrivivax sp.]|nr:DUF1302 family protein [Rubrivivax sp.]
MGASLLHWAVLRRLACLVALAGTTPVFGLGFVINDDLRGAWNNVITIGAGMRMRNPDASLIGFNNANQYPGASSPVAVGDDGNLNYRKGDVVSAPATWLSDLELRYRNQYGVFVRARGWYDYELNQGGVPHGHMNNGYVPGARLNDANMYRAEQFDGVQLLDAYVYGNWDLGDNRFSARLGRQVVNWGEGLLYTGINAFNPLNLAALGRPGGRPEDALIPVGRLWGSFITREGLNIEAFYTYDWERSTIPPCGTIAGLIDSQANRGCYGANIAVPLPDRAQYLLGIWAPVIPPIDGRKSGQWGVAARYFVEPLNTEFGIYYTRFNSTLPSVNMIPKDPNSKVGMAIQNEYVNGVQAAAISATTGFANVALSAELSTFFGLPVQRNFPTLIQGAAGQGGPYAAAAELGPGATYAGQIEVNRTQLLLGGRFNLQPTLGLADAQLTAEVALQWAPDMPGTDIERIGRNPNFGTASYNGVCQGGFNSCAVDGFATSFNWGYRLALQFSLPRPTSGLDLIPVLLWSQDVQGYAVDGSMVEGRYVGGVLLRAVYQSFLFAEIGATFIRNDTPYDGIRDRSAYAVGMGVRF